MSNVAHGPSRATAVVAVVVRIEGVASSKLASLSATVSQLLSAVGLTQASSVIALLRASELAAATVSPVANAIERECTAILAGAGPSRT